MASLEIRLNDRTSIGEMVKKDENHIEILVDGKNYTLDAVMVEEGVYSILLDGRSYTVELIEGEHAKKYNVNTLYRSFEIEIIDEETRYLLSRNKNLLGDEEHTIS